MELKEKFEDDSRVQAVESFVESLDPELLESTYVGCGKEAVPPDLLLRIALYEIIDSRPSPAQWAKDLKNDDALKFLGRFITPARSTCYEFRDRLYKCIEKVHNSLIASTILSGLMDPKVGVLDGTVVRAAGSRHHLLSEETVKSRTRELLEVVTADQSMKLVDQTSLSSWIATTPRGRRQQLQRYSKSCEIIDLRLLENAKRPKSKQLDAERVLVCPSEPEVQLAKDKEKLFCPMYNVQNLIDPVSGIIFVTDVFETATDARKIGTVLDLAVKTLNKGIQEVWADAGYCSIFDIQDCKARGVELFAPFQENSMTESKLKKKKKKSKEKTATTIPREQFRFDIVTNTYTCPQGQIGNYAGNEKVWRSGNEYAIRNRYSIPKEKCQACPLKSECLSARAKNRILTRTQGAEELEAMDAKMRTPEGKQRASQRSRVIERTFADAKHHRGGRRLHGFGLRRAKVEYMLYVLIQNLMTIYRKTNAHKTNEKQGP